MTVKKRKKRRPAQSDVWGDLVRLHTTGRRPAGWRRGLMTWTKVRLKWLELKRTKTKYAYDRAIAAVAAELHITQAALRIQLKRDLARLPAGVRDGLPTAAEWRAAYDGPPAPRPEPQIRMGRIFRPTFDKKGQRKSR